MTAKTLMVEAIENGTVIDHIPAGQAFRIMELLRVKNANNAVTLGLNLDSKRLGKKDVLKISDRFLSEAEANEIAVFASEAKINIIRDYQVVEKIIAKLPKQLSKILVCPNHNCISHAEPIDSLFEVEAGRSTIHLVCHYCERVFTRSEIQEYRT